MGPILELSENVVSSKVSKGRGIHKIVSRVHVFISANQILQKKRFLGVKKAFLIQQQEIFFF